MSKHSQKETIPLYFPVDTIKHGTENHFLVLLPIIDSQWRLDETKLRMDRLYGYAGAYHLITN